jgi:hypothetical protein
MCAMPASPRSTGTNGVQALDLVTRKITMADGAVAESFFAQVEADLAAAAAKAGEIAAETGKALALLRQATATLNAGDINAKGSGAVDYLRLFALVSMGWMWARMASAQGDSAVVDRKRALARFYAARVLPQAQGLASTIASSADVLYLLADEAF